MVRLSEQLPMFGDEAIDVPPPVVGWTSRADCSAIHRIEKRALLVCNWPANHGGPWHWDEGDQVVWREAATREAPPRNGGSRP